MSLSIRFFCVLCREAVIPRLVMGSVGEVFEHVVQEHFDQCDGNIANATWYIAEEGKRYLVRSRGVEKDF